MKKSLATLLLAFSTALVSAQTVLFESVRLADTFVEHGWSAVEQAMPNVLTVVENQLQKDGVSENASKIFVAELKRGMNRDAITKIVAESLTKNLSIAEMKELSAFLQSNIGKKFLQLNKDISTNSMYFAPILKHACEASAQQLSGTERRSFIGKCNQYQKE